VPVIPDNMKEFSLSFSYSDQHVAFVVKDERRAEFVDWKDIVDRKDLIICIPEKVYYKKAIKSYFTKGKAWEISTPRIFFKEEFKHIDAMLLGAPAASAWTLLNPNYTVVSLKPLLPALTMVFPINKNDPSFELFMRNWIEMKNKNKSLDRLFNYWIEGKQPDLMLIR
jgi:proton glutamate symport protein